MIKLIIGMDNGTTGSYAVIDMSGNIVHFDHVPTFKIQKWTKPKKTKSGKSSNGHITVIDIFKLKDDLKEVLKSVNMSEVKCYIERPAVGFSGWSVWTSLSGIAAWVAVQYVLIELGIEYHTIDSKEWQENLIPQALKLEHSKRKSGKKKLERNKDLKVASDKLALELYPSAKLKGSGDGDSINIAYNFYLKEKGEL